MATIIPQTVEIPVEDKVQEVVNNLLVCSNFQVGDNK